MSSKSIESLRGEMDKNPNRLIVFEVQRRDPKGRFEKGMPNRYLGRVSMISSRISILSVDIISPLTTNGRAISPNPLEGHQIIRTDKVHIVDSYLGGHFHSPRRTE